MIKFRPLEETLERLEKYAVEHSRKAFEQETRKFYQEMGVLSRYGHGVHPDTLAQMVSMYETRFNQLKFMLRGKP